MISIGALAIITFKEGIRSRSVYGIGLFSLFILALNVAVAGFFMRDVGKVTIDMNLSALSFAGLLLVFFVGLNLISKDIDRKTIQLVLSKPISRGEYIVGKFVGIEMFIFVSLLLLFSISCLTVLGLSILYDNFFSGFNWMIFFIAAFFVYVKISVLAAIVTFFSTISTSSFVTLIFSFCAYIVGETIEEVVFYLRTSLPEGSMAASESLKGATLFISYIVPNFSVFDYKTEAAYGLSVSALRLCSSLGYAFVCILLLLSFSAIIFKRREFN